MLGLSKLAQLATGKYVAVVLVLLLLAQGYFLIRPGTPRLDPVRAATADRVAAQIAEALGAHANQTWASKYVKVARLEGDHGDYIRTRIEAALQSRTNCRLVVDSVFAELRDELTAKAARLGIMHAVTADQLKAQPVANPDTALDLGRRARLDFVVFGRVEDFRLVQGRAYVKAAINVADINTGKVVFERRYEDGDSSVMADAVSEPFPAETRHAALRLVGWLLFVLLLPLGTGWFWRQFLERESMAVNLLCVLALTSVDGLLAWALMGFRLETVWYWLILLFAIIMAGNYNLLILNLLERSREKTKYAV